MEEYKFNSENNFSNAGERNAASPIQLSFKQPEKPKKKKTAKKVFLTIGALCLMVGISVGSGVIAAKYIVDSRLDSIANENTVLQSEDTLGDSVENGDATLNIGDNNSTDGKSPLDSVNSSQNAVIPEIHSPVVGTPNGTYASVATAVKDSVVEITTEMAAGNSYFQQFVESGAGSGVIISDDGYIITNNHVIEGASKITVRLTDGTEHEAKLIGTDAQADIAVLKITTDKNLSFAVIGNSENLTVGEEVLAIGNPLGELGGSVTNGIISALDREITIDGQTMRLLQTNAAINPGNSGGGLFNMKGELIAIVNAKSSGLGIEGLGFAIPINYAYEIASELLANGYVSGRPAMGISYIEISTYWDLMSYGVQAYGIYVYDGGDTPLENGDRIVSVGDYEIQYSASLKNAIQNYKVGDTVDVTVARGGRFVKLSVTLIESKPE
ncbi:MAG: trypsin-like peptidase domain-containing protein [Clostridia bacterium]|nr:trypsin-like peptidase domain-containing protein [Clostridia bacterium]